MLWFKSCSRCSGDLYSDRDTHGPYVACLQCGHYLTESEQVLIGSSNTMPNPQHRAPVQSKRVAA